MIDENVPSLFSVALTSEDETRDIFRASCPRCLVEVVRAQLPSGAILLVDASASLRIVTRPGIVSVTASEAGLVRVVETFLFKTHVCDCRYMLNPSGGYVAEVLACSCPVYSCRALIDEYCVSSRGSVLSSPHGARVALSKNVSWTDEEFTLTSEDE